MAFVLSTTAKGDSANCLESVVQFHAQAFRILIEALHPSERCFNIASDIAANLSGYGCLCVAKAARLC